MKTHMPSKLALALGLTLGLPAALTAQTAPPASPATTPEETKEEVVQLSPFVVNVEKDYGYIAVDSLAGGRTNTPVKLTPASISSLTRTFLDDLGIQNIREAVKWAPNVVPTDVNAGKGFGGAAFHAWSFNYRSAGAGQQGGPGPTRNYFSFYQDADAYNIERVEFLRGPNSLVFGLGTVGGTLATYTKIPRVDKSFTTVTTTMDDNGSLRFEFDVNQRLTDKLTARVNALYDDNEGWRNGDTNEMRAVDVALLYRLSQQTTLRVELEGAHKEKTLISSSISDKLSGWDGVTASQTWGATPTGGTARTEHMQNAGAWGDWLNPFWVYTPSLGRNSLMGWAGGWASTTSMTETWAALPYQPKAGWYPSAIKLDWHSTYQSTANIPLMPSSDWTYGHGINDIEYRNLTAFLDHEFSRNLQASVSFYRYYDDQAAKDYEGTGGAAIDINKQLPDGSPNPNYGKAFADFFLSKQTQRRAVTEARAQVDYNFEAEILGTKLKQRFSASAARKEVNISARQYLGQVGNGTSITNPADWVQNMVWGRIYLDRPNQLLNPPEVAPNGRAISYMPKADGYWFDFDDTFKLTDVAVVSHSLLFNDNLSILAGVRRDSYDEHIVELRRGPNLSDKISDESQSGDTYSAGAIQYLPGAPWLGLFVNYSQNIQPPNPGSQPLINGSRPSPEEGKGLDYGIRISTGDGKYYAVLSRYDTQSDGHLVENPIGLRGIWQKYNLVKGLSNDSGFGSLAYSDTTARDVTGYEFEITANPFNGLRIQASYAKPEATVVDFYPGARAHFAENLATWNAAVNGTESTASNRDALRGEIASVQSALNNAQPGVVQSGSVKYTASLFAHYTFTDGALKGLSFGGGATKTGKVYAGIFDTKETWADAVTNTSAVISYETKFGRIPARFALNIDNVLDEDDPVVTGYHWGYRDQNGGLVADQFYLRAPRSFRLSARFTF
jgi:outer membrane receptor protein involved in Fe transport